MISWTQASSRETLKWFAERRYCHDDEGPNLEQEAASAAAVPMAVASVEAAATLPPSKRLKVSEDSEEEESEESAFPPCSICHTEPADTIALPCGHCCVCHQCSRELAKRPQLPDHSVCVQCRKPITAVDEPGGVVQIK